MTLYASNQTTIQKFNSVSTLRDAKKSIWMATCSSAIFLTMVCLAGLVAYANYWDCDPLKSGKILKYDQLVPHLVMDVMGHLHGLPGLFIAATFSAALSSLSGNLTALSAVILSDFIGPLVLKMNGRNLEESTRSLVSKTLILSLGLLVTGLGFAAQFFGDVVVQVSFSIFGFVGGPLFGVVTLGIFVPFINDIGVVAGLLSSLGITSWIAIGSTVAQLSHQTLPISTDGCHNNSTTVIPMTTVLYDLVNDYIPQESQVLSIYKVSYMYYGLIALFVSAVVAVPVSLLTGRTRKVNPKLVVDYRKTCHCCLPAKFQKSYFLCGTQLEEEELSTPDESEKHPENCYTNQSFDERNEITVKVTLPEGGVASEEGRHVRSRPCSTHNHLQPPNDHQTYATIAQTILLEENNNSTAQLNDRF